jgi:dephospho-CoA kinase
MTVGLTGGIGSGKSLAARIFEMLGCPIFNSDETAKKVYFENHIQKEVIALLGPESYLDKNHIDKQFIAKKIFSETALLHRLNAIIHPEVRKKFSQFVEENQGKVIIKETALLFEAGLSKEVDKIILVTANTDLRIKRVIERDGITEKEVRNKMKAQLPDEEKLKLSDFVIYNNEKEFVITQVISIYEKLKTL